MPTQIHEQGDSVNIDITENPTLINLNTQDQPDSPVVNAPCPPSTPIVLHVAESASSPGPPGPPGDSYWVKVGDNIIYDVISGKVIIGPDSELSVEGEISTTFPEGMIKVDNLGKLRPAVPSVDFLKNETDPVFSASTAAGITGSQVSNWQAAYGWGNHASAGYLVPASLSGYATESWVQSRGYLLSETDPVFSASAAAGITHGHINSWQMAYSWGDHSSQGYLTPGSLAGYATEAWVLNLGIGAHPDVEITTPLNNQILIYTGGKWVNWTPDYLNIILLTGAVTGISNASGFITTTIANAAVDNPKLASMAAGTVKGRANGSGPGTPQDLTPAQLRTILNISDGANNYLHPDSGVIPGSYNVVAVDAQGHVTYGLNFPYLLTETDPIFGAHVASGITGMQISNWQASFGWGNHAGLYRPVAWTPSWADVTGKPTTFTPAAHTLGSHSDVTITSPVTGQLTRYNGTAWVNWMPNFLTSYTETDPIFSAHVAFGITGMQISNWQASFGWGNHAGLYRPVAWTPSWSDVTGKPTTFTPSAHTLGSHSDVTITSPVTGQLTRYNGTAWVNWMPNFLTSYTETDPIFSAHVAFGITGAQISNWQAAFGWGNHTGLYRPVAWTPSWADVTGKPTTFTPSAHTLGSHSDVTITSPVTGQLTRYNGTAWVNWMPNFLTSYTETDPIFSAHVAFGITGAQISNWQAAFGWGNHTGLYRPVAWTPSWADVTGKPTTFTPAAHTLGSHSDVTITSPVTGQLTRYNGTAWVNWMPNFLTSYTETDPIFGAHVASGITGMQISNWQASFGWGNHAGLYRPVAWTPSWSDVTGKPTTFTPAAHTLGSHSDVTITSPVTGQLTRYNGTAWVNWMPNFLTTNNEATATLITQNINLGSGVLGTSAFYAGASSSDSPPQMPYNNGAIMSWKTDFGNFQTFIGRTAQDNYFFRNQSGTWYWVASREWVTSRNFLTSYTETDPIFSAHVAFGITGAQISNWQAAFGWGNHTGLYRPVAWTPSWADVTGKPTTFTPAAHTLGSHSDVTITSPVTGQLTRYNGTAWVNWMPNFLTSYTETDPIFSAHVAFGITGAQISNWQAAFGWGNHTGLYRPVAWVPSWSDVTGKPTTFTPAAHTLGSHSDVTITSPVTGQLTRYNGTAWVNWMPNFLTTNNEATATLITQNINLGSGVLGTSAFYAGASSSDSPPQMPYNNGAIMSWKTDFGNFQTFIGRTAQDNYFFRNQSGTWYWVASREWVTSRNFLTSYTETDPIFSAHVAFGITGAQISNWQASFGWGNHAGLYRPVAWTPSWSDVTGKPTTFTPSAHTLGSHSDVTITSPVTGQLTRYNGTAWVNWMPNFLTSYTETDPIFSAHVAFGITGAQISNWQASFGWGNHAGLYRPVAWTPSWADVTGKPTTFTPAAHTLGSHSDVTITSPVTGQLTRYNGTAWVNWMPNFLTSYTETDPIFSAHVAFGITGAQISNWQASFGWGNHTGLYRPVAWVPSWSDVTGKPNSGNFIFSQIVSAQTANLWITGKGIFGGAADNGYKVQINAGSPTALGLYVNGTIFSTDDTTNFSDARKKTNVFVIAKALEKLRKISGYSYDYDNQPRYGFLAQEIKKILPHAVGEYAGSLTLRYNAVAALAIQATKELDQDVSTLRKGLESAQETISKLNTEIECLKSRLQM